MITKIVNKHDLSLLETEMGVALQTKWDAFEDQIPKLAVRRRFKLFDRLKYDGDNNFLQMNWVSKLYGSYFKKSSTLALEDKVD